MSTWIRLPCTTHPRVCGEHPDLSRSISQNTDSPPRVRGALRLVHHMAGAPRLTPACAGSTWSASRTWQWPTTHPRVCGEHTGGDDSASRGVDSPPRVRGAPSPCAGQHSQSRLTPACAGSTAVLPLRRPVGTTHPRVCGEHARAHSFSACHTDSPPRVRGALLAVGVPDDRPRLTPACAGSTPSRRAGRATASTHPRVCGEHLWARFRVDHRDDSPPRVRGARLVACDRHGIRRLTPACAGSTANTMTMFLCQTTHPRVCGEHWIDLALGPALLRSPPRVRGALVPRLGAGWEYRLTPACAGSTACPPGAPAPASTHPRVCGEHSAASPMSSTWTDSPPRVRGARVHSHQRHDDFRLTPACAGSTLSRYRIRAGSSTHPRVCGEHRVRRRPGHRRGRLTPACAGSTTSRCRRCPSPPTHPRVCGEHAPLPTSIRPTADSPPRVRGAPLRRDHGMTAGRLTPACAGSTQGRARRAAP